MAVAIDRIAGLQKGLNVGLIRDRPGAFAVVHEPRRQRLGVGPDLN